MVAPGKIKRQQQNRNVLKLRLNELTDGDRVADIILEVRR